MKRLIISLGDFWFGSITGIELFTITTPKFYRGLFCFVYDFEDKELFIDFLFLNIYGHKN